MTNRVVLKELHVVEMKKCVPDDPHPSLTLCLHSYKSASATSVVCVLSYESVLSRSRFWVNMVVDNLKSYF